MRVSSDDLEWHWKAGHKWLNFSGWSSHTCSNSLTNNDQIRNGSTREEGRVSAGQARGVAAFLIFFRPSYLRSYSLTHTHSNQIRHGGTWEKMFLEGQACPYPKGLDPTAPHFWDVLYILPHSLRHRNQILHGDETR